MARVAVCTPTCRAGGLDVTYHGLKRQIGGHEIIWIIADELVDERRDIVAAKVEDMEVIHFKLPLGDGDTHTLTSSMQAGLEYARDLDVDLYVSLQDYIWIPDDGIERYLQLADRGCFLTGLCSHSTDPGPDDVVDIDGLWTVFGKDYVDKPTTIGWQDVRERGFTDPIIVDQIWWEMNWSAVPASIVYDTRVNFDPAFDAGIGYENQDYVYTGLQYGYQVMLDEGNHSISLPHKKYWPEQERFFGTHVPINRELMMKKWGMNI